MSVDPPAKTSGKTASSTDGRTSPARSAAVAVLEIVYRHPDRDVPMPVLLNEHSARLRLTSRDTALAMELVYGVLRTEKRLWGFLSPLLRKPDSLPVPLKILLLTACYELLYLDHIPGRATLHQTVDMTRRRFGPTMGGLVNAVLRALDSQSITYKQKDAALSTPPETASLALEDIALAGSLPGWLAALWLGDYGPERAWHFARHSAVRPSPSWRVNRISPGSAALLRDATAGGAMPVGRSGLLVPALSRNMPAGDAAPAAHTPDWKCLEKEGRISRQGTGSLLLAEYLASVLRNDPALAGEPVWDACCGRGGKTCALLENGVPVALSSDPSPRRLEDLRNALTRLQLPCPDIRLGSLQELAPGFPTRFPVILLDAPCSGTGTLARNPELRQRLTPHRLEEAAKLQAELLRHAWTALAPGGLLAYATCALNKAENEGQIQAFLAATSSARLAEQQLFEPAAPGQDSLFLALLRKS